jgi:hypothetical protein
MLRQGETGRLPSFLVIGAAKAATTWVAWQLRARSDIYMPGPEPHFFSREHHRGADWYARLFAAGRKDQLIGEKSADYLADPQVPSRMAQLLPDARLIVQLRNPVERAYSDYCMLFRQGRAGPDIEKEMGATSRFLADGLYARHIARFREYYPSERIKVLFFEDIVLQPEQVMRDVASFLDLPARAPVVDLHRPVNDGRAPVLPWALRRLPPSVKNLVRPFRGTEPFETIRAMMSRRVIYPTLTAAMRRRLRDYYGDDVQALSKMLDRDLSVWSGASRTA